VAGRCPASTTFLGAMTTRGIDQGHRKKRGAPSESTSHKRAAAHEAKTKASRAKGAAALGLVVMAPIAATAEPAPEVLVAATAAAVVVAPATITLVGVAALRAATLLAEISASTTGAPTPETAPTIAQSPPPVAAASVAAMFAVDVTAGDRGDAPPHPDIIAELDDDEQLEDAAVGPGVMQTYLKAMKDLLKNEVASHGANSWLLSLLEENEWWVRAVHAPKVCKKLGIPCTEPTYYRDVYVWLPDVRWGEMPFCPNCESNARVTSHCWRDNHDGRRICTINTNYFALSRRYKCNACAEAAKSMKVAAAVAEGRIPMDDGESTDEESAEVEVPAQTFMGWDEDARKYLAYNRGEEFPAFLTYRGGVDKAVVDLLRPMFDKGVSEQVITINDNDDNVLISCRSMPRWLSLFYSRCGPLRSRRSCSSSTLRSTPRTTLSESTL
jgi:hypothetical protein